MKPLCSVPAAISWFVLHASLTSKHKHRRWEKKCTENARNFPDNCAVLYCSTVLSTTLSSTA
jgi:polyferredoxin